MSCEQTTAPTFYPQAFEKLRQFQTESTSSQSGSFKWRVSDETVAEVTEFLISANDHGLIEPQLAKKIDGDVAVFWDTGGGTGDWYISADFSNKAYIYAISQVPGQGVPGLIKCGHSKTNEICAVMVECVKLAYQDQGDQQ
jgi:hypothetical protein